MQLALALPRAASAPVCVKKAFVRWTCLLELWSLDHVARKALPLTLVLVLKRKQFVGCRKRCVDNFPLVSHNDR